MVTPNDDLLTKTSTDGATDFVQSFYSALQSNRGALSTFYSSTALTILLNGNLVADGAAVQDIFVNQMPPTHYEVQSFDCQIINRKYPTLTPTGIKAPTEMTVKDMSILVTVSGYVRFGESRDLPQRGFSESFVLVPNPNVSQPKGRGKKEWLIQSQTFRLVV